MRIRFDAYPPATGRTEPEPQVLFREMGAVPRVGERVEIEDRDFVVRAVNWTPDSEDEDVVVSIGQ